MCVQSSIHRVTGVFGAALFTILALTSSGLRAELPPRASRSAPDSLATVKIVDVLNLFANVGALIYFVEPNDFGLPPGVITHCSGTLIHERVFLVAGHCTAPTAYRIRRSARSGPASASSRSRP